MAMFTHRRLLSIIGYLRLAAAVPLISISWVLSQDGESPMAACHRLNPQYIELPNEFQLTWDVTALNGALSYINNRISPSVINPYGILGCCASGLWCKRDGCFTQSIGSSYFSNYGFLPNDSSAYPVYACVPNFIPFINDPISIQQAQMGMNANVTITGMTNVYIEESYISVSVDGRRCEHVEECSLQCQPCNTNTNNPCPLGSSCLHDKGQSTGGCYQICGGSFDKSCPCGLTCQEQYSSQKDTNFCSPLPFSVGNICSQYFNTHNPFDLQCQAYYTSSSTQSSVVSASFLDVNSIIGLSTIRTQLFPLTCSLDLDCFDNNICTQNKCVAGTCQYTFRDQCTSTLPSIKEQYSPRRCLVFTFMNQLADQNTFIDSLSSAENESPAEALRNVPTVIADVGFSFNYFGTAGRSITLSPNGLLQLPPFLPCTDVIGSSKCLMYSSLSNVVSVWASDWSPSASLRIYYTNTTSSLHILYANISRTSLPQSMNTFGVSLFTDGSIVMRYISVTSGFDYQDTFGLWNSKASERQLSSRAHNNVNVSSGLVISGNNLVYCQFNSVACAVEACVSPDLPLVLLWSTPDCSALPTPLVYSCIWAGGVASSPATLGLDSRGYITNVSCDVPVLSFANGTLITVSLDVTANGEKPTQTDFTIYGITLDGQEQSNHHIMVQYYSSGSPTCGCSALRELPGLTCDLCNVCGGSGGTVDCNGDCFGSAYLYYNNTCIGGLTGKTASVSAGYPLIPTEDDSIYNLISLIVLIGFFVMILLVLCLCLRIILLGAPSPQDNEIVVIAFNVADTLGIRRVLLTPSQLDEIGEFTHGETKQFPFRSDTMSEVADVEGTEGLSTSECSICLCEFANGDICRRLPDPCCHTFHKACIDQWFVSSSNCPLCKRSIYRVLLEKSGRRVSLDDDVNSMSPPGGYGLSNRRRVLQTRSPTTVPTRSASSRL